MKRTLLLSYIPATKSHDGLAWQTQALWAHDINANAGFLDIDLLCPVKSHGPTSPDMTPLKPNIVVHDLDSISADKLRNLVAQADFVQVPGNFTWKKSLTARRLLHMAKRSKTIGIVGISSNRARTAIMNARGRSLLRRGYARLQALSIRVSQRWLIRHADGVHVVGQGLRNLAQKDARSLHVGTASWISATDLRSMRPSQGDPVDIVMAARLEVMKGMSLGIEAIQKTYQAWPNLRLSVIGVGPEESRLREQVRQAGLESITRFEGQLGYPEAFFNRLQRADYVLLTNLNDEQPRLIFDAISQGAIPVCPNNRAYTALGLDPMLLYRQGSAEELSNILLQLMHVDGAGREKILAHLSEIAANHTIEAMHKHRLTWLESLQISDR